MYTLSNGFSLPVYVALLKQLREYSANVPFTEEKNHMPSKILTKWELWRQRVYIAKGENLVPKSMSTLSWKFVFVYDP